MSADVIDFYTREKIPQEHLDDFAAVYLASATEFNHALAVWPDFSTAARYHAPDQDAS